MKEQMEYKATNNLFATVDEYVGYCNVMGREGWMLVASGASGPKGELLMTWMRKKGEQLVSVKSGFIVGGNQGGKGL